MMAEQTDKKTPGRAAPVPGTISVCIVCRNEADKLGPALASVTWADEILLMDLQSTDGSAALAEAYGARVISHAPYPIVEPLRNELAALARSDWVLGLDPDERVTPGLAEALRQAAHRPELDGVLIPRTNYDLGYPPSNPIHRYEMHLRMYRPARLTWPTMPNAQPEVPAERLHRLPSDDRLVMIHERSRNVPEVLDRVVRYAPMQGQAMADQGQVFSAEALLAAMAQVVDKQFLLGRPWEDGVPGLLRAGLLTAFKFYVWVAFWQASGAQRTPADDRVARRWGRVFYFVARVVRLALRGYLAVRRRLWP